MSEKILSSEPRFGTLVSDVLAAGAFKANIIDEKEVVTDVRFREACKQNSCGAYGKCWTCPPDIGDIETLIASLSAYRYVLVYQTVGELEDSFDFEGMTECKEKHNVLVSRVRKLIAEKNITDALCLGAGGCFICPTCAKRTNEPCRHPDLAISSLEAHGIYVAKLAESAGMKYINGQNTVTYFGAVFFNL